MKHLTPNSPARDHRRSRSILAIALGLAFAAPAAHADKVGAFEMLVYEDSKQGRLLIQGEWEKAEAMSDTVAKTRFAAFNDRCVSLTIARDFDRAEVVCNDAVRAARRSEHSRSTRSSSPMTTGDKRTNRAMAHTNRGVLRAFQGEGEAAREDFELAIALDADINAAATNLELLETRLAMAIAN